MDNQRQYPRVNYPCSLTFWRADSTQEVILANSANIGAGGLFVHLNQKILPGTKVEIKIEFAGQLKPFKCFGKVLRCQQPPQEGIKKFFSLAVQFEPLEEHQQARLQGIVDGLIALENKKSKP
ncbi:MAG: PilZ domain-containing protein [Candidatus Omnitrophica bacterium]|nr:PilZ domain-containing protein [Candidatus Omnitrophota bacterium]